MCLVLSHSANKQECVHKSLRAAELERWRGSRQHLLFVPASKHCEFSKGALLYTGRDASAKFISPSVSHVTPLTGKHGRPGWTNTASACSSPHFCPWLITPLQEQGFQASCACMCARACVFSAGTLECWENEKCTSTTQSSCNLRKKFRAWLQANSSPFTSFTYKNNFWYIAHVTQNIIVILCRMTHQWLSDSSPAA